MIIAGVVAGALGGLALYASSPSVETSVPSALLVPIGFVAIAAGAALAFGGLCWAVFRPVLGGPRAAAAEFGSHRVILTTTALTVLLAVILAALAGELFPAAVSGAGRRHNLQSLPGFLSGAVSISLVFLAVVYFRFLRPGVVSLSDFGFARNRLAPRFANQVWLAHLISGLGGGLLGLFLSGSVQALMRSMGVQQTQLMDFTWVRQLRLESFGLIFFAGALLAPLAEEIFFRGIVFRSYLLAKGPLVAYLASALVFASLHLNLPALPPIVVLGLVLAWLYHATGSLVPSVLAHAFNNGVAFIVLYFVPEHLLPGGG